VDHAKDLFPHLNNLLPEQLPEMLSRLPPDLWKSDPASVRALVTKLPIDQQAEHLKKLDLIQTSPTELGKKWAAQLASNDPDAPKFQDIAPWIEKNPELAETLIPLLHKDLQEFARGSQYSAKPPGITC
jgi:hypothetical protein